MAIGWQTLLAPFERELMDLAARLESAAEPAYQENNTRGIWQAFAGRHNLPLEWWLAGRAPVIDLGDMRSAWTRVVLPADLDAVAVAGKEPSSPSHPLSWAHLCGHHAQSVHVLGAALLLSGQELPAGLAVRIVGCPAEECLPAFDPNCRLPFTPGKRRLLADGCFHGATAVLATHLADDDPGRRLHFAHGARGFVWIRCHAGTELSASPYTETDKLTVRRVAEEVAGKTAVGTRITLSDARTLELRMDTAPTPAGPPVLAARLQGALKREGFRAELVSEYAPLVHDDSLRAIARQTVRESADGEDIDVVDTLWLRGATDLGDVSQHVPTFQTFIGGTRGRTHDPDFQVVDPVFAYLWPCFYLYRAVMSVHLHGMGE